MNIFENDDDHIEFERILNRMTDDEGVDVMAWCHMSNHVHLLLYGSMISISKAMQRALGAYASYFNTAYEHAGHLFQGRFHSVPIENDAQLMEAVRYIHLNPDAAGCASYLDYEWSSYRGYVSEKGEADELHPQSRSILDIFGSTAEFERFHARGVLEARLKAKEGSAACAKPGHNGISEALARVIAEEIADGIELMDLAGMPRSIRNRTLTKMKKRGLSIRQIERLTGIGRGIIQRANEGQE